MSIDFNKIAQDKIAEMEGNGEIKKHLEEKLQALILESVSSAIGGYSFKRQIQERIEKSVSPVLEAMDFTAYNSFICEKVKQITEEYLKVDIAKKISDTFENIFMLKQESIKLSEIFEAYRDWLIEDLDENERYELENSFFAEIEQSEHGWLECCMSDSRPSNTSYLGKSQNVYNSDFGFILHKIYDKDFNPTDSGYIGSAYFKGSGIQNMVKITSYNKFQSLIINLYYNKTPVIIDIDEDDIDTSLGLDF